jgi:hypothetical protein
MLSIETLRSARDFSCGHSEPIILVVGPRSRTRATV